MYFQQKEDFDRPYPFNDPDEEWIDIKIVII